MTKLLTLLLLILLNSLVVADQIQTVTAQSCCSSCASIINSTIYPVKLRNQIFSSIDSNQPTEANIVRLLNILPYDYFRQFKKSMFNFNKMVNTGIGSCSVDVSGTDEVPYSDYNNQTLSFYFEVTDATVWDYMKQTGQSPNFINTYKNLMYVIRKQVTQILNGEVLLPLSVTAEKFASQHGIGAIYSLASSQQATNYNRTLDSMNDPIDFCAKNMANLGCVQLYSTDNTNIKLSRPLNTFNVPTSDATLSKTTFFSKIMNTPQVSLYPIILDKVRDGEPGIFTSQYMSFYNMIDFTGKIYVPPGVDLSTLPNNGFGFGETTHTVWAKIMASMFGPYLHCKYPGMLNTLTQGSSCYASCSSTC